MVQEGGGDMGNTSPKFGVGWWSVRRGGQSAVKVTETENGWRRKKTKIRQKKENGWRRKKNKDPAKKDLKNKKIGNNVARGVRALRPSHLSLRPALWTISTSGKPLHV